ncbi:MAG: hypothetical protein ABI352_05545 [Candidatus Dormibacter sp.]
MTAGWVVINIVMAVVVTAIVGGTAMLVPHLLHRQAMRNDRAYARYHNALNVHAVRDAAPQRRTETECAAQAA